jgi:hypothetical protein
LGTSTLSGENLHYDLDALGDLIHEGKFESDFNEYLWDTFLCDAFINNIDRHPNNWGFFKRDGVYRQAPLFDCASSLYSINAFALSKMSDLESYILKFSNSAIHYKGIRHSFAEIVLQEKSKVFTACLQEFKSRLRNIDFSCIDNVKLSWPQYAAYADFVRTFFERQVKWFESAV